MQPGFPKCGACELIFASEKGGLWTENFQIWGACELKISQFGGLWAENFQIWGLRAKIEAVEVKISKILKWGSCELTLLLEMEPLRTAGAAWSGGLLHPHTPLSRSVPPGHLIQENSYGWTWWKESLYSSSLSILELSMPPLWSTLEEKIQFLLLNLSLTQSYWLCLASWFKATFEIFETENSNRSPTLKEIFRVNNEKQVSTKRYLRSLNCTQVV